MDMMTMVQRLTAVYGISGREAAVAEEIRRMAEPYADEIWTDRLGNLICHKKGEGPKVMFAAHLDSIGLIVTHIESAGFLRVAKIGGVRPEKILHSLVRFENGTIGTIASSGTDLGKLSMEDLYVDIGAESREEAEKKVSVGDAAVYMGQPVQTGTTLFSPYLDDRLGCVILLKTMELAADSPNDLYFVYGPGGSGTMRRPYGGPWDRPGLRDRGGRYMYGRCSREQAYGFRGAGKGRWDQGDGRLPDVPWSCGRAA